MEIHKTYRYRLEPNRAQVEKMEWVLDRCRELYNAALQERRDAYKSTGVSINYYDQSAQLPGIKQDRPEYRDIGSQILRDVLRRLDRAFAAFFRRCKTGEVPGYPRFRGRARYDSFTCPIYGNGCKIREGRLYVRGVGLLKVRWHRPVQGTIKTVTIERDADRWEVAFTCVLVIAQPPAADRPSTGLDMGLERFATLANGDHIDNPRYQRRDQEVVARRERAVPGKQPGSKNRGRARLLVSRARRRVRNKRRNFHHQEARKIVDTYGAIAVEGLRIKNLVRRPQPALDVAQSSVAGHAVYAPNGASRKSGLSQSIHDAGWNQFLSILAHKAVEAGVVVVAVNPAGTSQMCSGCGRVVPKTLSERWHICPYDDCGLSLQRDHNAARVILNRAGLARAVASVPAAESPG